MPDIRAGARKPWSYTLTFTVRIVATCKPDSGGYASLFTDILSEIQPITST